MYLLFSAFSVEFIKASILWSLYIENKVLAIVCLSMLLCITAVITGLRRKRLKKEKKTGCTPYNRCNRNRSKSRGRTESGFKYFWFRL